MPKMEHDRQSPHQALGHGPERLVGRQIRPGRAPLARLDPVSGGTLEADRDFLVDRPRLIEEGRFSLADDEEDDGNNR